MPLLYKYTIASMVRYPITTKVKEKEIVKGFFAMIKPQKPIKAIKLAKYQLGHKGFSSFFSCIKALPSLKLASNHTPKKTKAKPTDIILGVLNIKIPLCMYGSGFMPNNRTTIKTAPTKTVL